MAQIVTLLAGLLIAGIVFVSLFWSASRATGQTGRTRLAHLAHGVAILGAMALLTFEAFAASRLAGLVLIGTGIATAAIDAGGSRLLPLMGAAFGLALALGLPFASG